MPRKIRVEYADAIYHVMSRGDRREDIFLDDVDRQDFIKTLAEACQKTGWQVHVPARVVFGERGFPGGDAAEDGGEVGRKPFRGVAARDGAGERREDRGGRVEAVGTLRRGCDWAVPEVRTRGCTGGCGTVQRRNE